MTFLIVTELVVEQRNEYVTLKSQKKKKKKKSMKPLSFWRKKFKEPNHVKIIGQNQQIKRLQEFTLWRSRNESD